MKEEIWLLAVTWPVSTCSLAGLAQTADRVLTGICAESPPETQSHATGAKEPASTWVAGSVSGSFSPHFHSVGDKDASIHRTHRGGFESLSPAMAQCDGPV